MPIVNIKTKTHLVSMKTEKVARNIFIDFTKNEEKKIKALDSISNFNLPTLDYLKEKGIIVW